LVEGRLMMHKNERLSLALLGESAYFSSVDKSNEGVENYFGNISHQRVVRIHPRRVRFLLFLRLRLYRFFVD
jgi:hypothetical protein